MDSERERIFEQYENAVHAFSRVVEKIRNSASGNFHRAMREIDIAHRDVEKWSQALKDYDHEHAVSSDERGRGAAKRRAQAR